jgi:hypothetical protein
MFDFLKRLFGRRFDLEKPVNPPAAPVCREDLAPPGLCTVVNRFTGQTFFGPDVRHRCIAERRRLNCGLKYHPYMVLDSRGRSVSSIRGKLRLAA